MFGTCSLCLVNCQLRVTSQLLSFQMQNFRNVSGFHVESFELVARQLYSFSNKAKLNGLNCTVNDSTSGQLADLLEIEEISNLVCLT